MKKAFILLGLSTAIVALTGCQDEQATNTLKEQSTEVAEVTAPVVDATEAVLSAIDQHNANNSLDWDGVYFGTLPCADCEGIETKITLSNDGSYSVNQTYLGRVEGFFESRGQFSWNDSGNIITLENESGANQYFVGENVLFKLDMNGQRVEGDLAAHYRLHKQ